MAISLVDTAVPMNDTGYPVARAKHIWLDNDINLQKAIDDGLIGGGTSITVDSAMSDTSINPVQNKVIKAYVDSKSVDISADSDNAIQTKTDGIYVEKTKISTDDGNALSEKSNGLFVEDLSNKVNALNIAQKTVNSELEYYYATKTTSISGVSIKDSNLINYLPYLTNITSNLEPSRYNTEGITLKKSKTYRITFGLARATTSGNGSSAYVMDSDGNKLGNRGYFGSNSYSDNIIDVIYTPTKDISVYPALVNLNTNLGSTYYPDCSFFQVTEIGREVIIDPVEYVDSTKGIEDTPVGNIITCAATNAPNHYLLCDGTEYNISDYPYLAQHFLNEFGSVNYYGGDGINTFAMTTLDNKISKVRQNVAMVTSNTNNYVVTASSYYSKGYAPWMAFSGSNSSNFWSTSSHANGSSHWLKIDFKENILFNQIVQLCQTDEPSNGMAKFEVLISNDDINYKSVAVNNDVGNINRIIDLNKICNARYVKFDIVQSAPSYVSIRDISLNLILIQQNSFIKYEPTYFMKNIYNADSVNYTDEEIREAVSAVLGGTE